nr:MAG TPA: hypothetical protein [Caudoviricetes sp.]DAP07728.1 MAG TPA: hypothetical protein [Caudoviricetes sp.]
MQYFSLYILYVLYRLIYFHFTQNQLPEHLRKYH